MENEANKKKENRIIKEYEKKKKSKKRTRGPYRKSSPIKYKNESKENEHK